jgi:hypothetical protein
VSAMPPTRERAKKAEPEPQPGSDLAASLWVLAALIAAFELVWWFFDRMYSA